MNKVIICYVIIYFNIGITSVSAMLNFEIADKAMEHIGEDRGQCKVFVQDVIAELGGSLGIGYRACYLSSGKEILSPDNAMKGDIIQISHNTDPENSTERVHTAIVVDNLGNGNFKVVHANWCSPFCSHTAVSCPSECWVKITDSWNPTTWSTSNSVITGYSAHFYRLGEVNQYNFTFSNGSSDGMSPNWCMTEDPINGVNEWRVRVSATEDPGIDSPSYPPGLLANSIIIEFSAKVENGGDPVNEGKVYIKDENGQWKEDNFVYLQLINNEEENYNNGDFANNDYNVYRAVLADIGKDDLQMRQFSIQLTNGLSSSETWTFDRIDVKVVAWDFKDNTIAWEYGKDGETADFYPAAPDSDFWRINPTGKRPQIMSPDNLMIADFYTQVGIRYSIQNTTEEILRVYFDIGDGFTNEWMAERGVDDNKIPHNGYSKTHKFDIPEGARGKIKRIMFDLFDNETYQNKQIAINNISFLANNEITATYTVPIDSDFLSSNTGGSDGDYLFVNATTTKTIQNGIPIGESDKFYSFDNYAGIWLELRDIYDSLNVTWEWYRPDGSFYGECSYITDWPTNGTWSSIKLYRFIDIAGLAEYGDWKVEVSVNGQNINTQYFSYLESPEAPVIESLKTPLNFNVIRN